MAEYKLTYFNIRARGEHIRFIFAYAGVPYEDIRINFKDWPDMEPKIKTGQLPILQFDGKELSQSQAIARFLAGKYDLVAEDPFVAARADEVAGFMTELQLEFRTASIEKDEAKKSVFQDEFVKTVAPKYYGIMEELVASTGSGKFIRGDKPSWQDFYIANWIEIFGDGLVGENFVDQYPNLKKVKEAVFAIPAIKAHVDKRPKSKI